ncbi:MAG: hypothetical protein GY810_12590 [Aureispira sp.]|nr:hypothetical protein [Aureispira sp.]
MLQQAKTLLNTGNFPEFMVLYQVWKILLTRKKIYADKYKHETYVTFAKEIEKRVHEGKEICMALLRHFEFFQLNRIDYYIPDCDLKFKQLIEDIWLDAPNLSNPKSQRLAWLTKGDYYGGVHDELPKALGYFEQSWKSITSSDMVLETCLRHFSLTLIRFPLISPYTNLSKIRLI